MYAYLIGTIADKNDGGIILETNDIGYQIAISARSMADLEIGSIAKIYTIMTVREDALLLFGFADVKEKAMFELLNRVSAVGPKLALAILSEMSVPELQTAVLNSDIDRLVRTPGVGKKTASRILLELIDPIKKMGITSAAGDAAAPKPINTNGAVAVEALINLGYSKQEVERAVAALDGEHLTLESLIKQALMRLA